MFCPKCGTKNIDEARFCGACGTPLVANAGMPAPQAAQVQPSVATGGKNALPLLIAGAAAGFIVVVLIAVFVVVPAFNKNPFRGCQVGDVVEFGSYEQDGDTSNGKEPIEWRVLAVEDDRTYVVSDKALEARAYNEDREDGNNFGTSDLWGWFNDDFVNTAFTSDEMEEIDGTPSLLSVDEAKKYFKSNEDRQCYPTKHVLQQLGWDSDESVGWWLSVTTDGTSTSAPGVWPNGYVSSDAWFVDLPVGGVRPAMWVKM